MIAPQTKRRLEQLEASMGADDDDVIEIVIVGVGPDGTETAWNTLRIPRPRTSKDGGE
jgi:hypothetical protein